MLQWPADEGTYLRKLLLDQNSLPIKPRIHSQDPMDEIESRPHTVYFDSAQLSGLTGEEIIQHLATTFWIRTRGINVNLCALRRL